MTDELLARLNGFEDLARDLRARLVLAYEAVGKDGRSVWTASLVPTSGPMADHIATLDEKVVGRDDALERALDALVAELRRVRRRALAATDALGEFLGPLEGVP